MANAFAPSPSLICGGHSFITQLGNGTPLSTGGIRKLVRTCLDAGITRFDTTYQPERVALGRALAELDARDAVEIIAWNFFEPFGPADEVSTPDYYRPHHLDRMLTELRTDRIDCLVVHALQDTDENARQEELAAQWLHDGHVRALGCWNPSTDFLHMNTPYTFMVKPFNIRTAADAAPAFRAAAEHGIHTMACSPFVRGWMLDTMVKNAAEVSGGTATGLRSRLADHLLRFSLFATDIDALIVAMRNPALAAANTAAMARGALNTEEREWLLSVSPDPH